MEIDKTYVHDDDVLLSIERSPPPPPSCNEFPTYSLQGDSASGSASMVNFHNSPPENARLEGFLPSVIKQESGHEDYDPCIHQPEKKRRLTVDQVKFLEESFEVENKLEPERKVQLAKDLGLQPRQVAIWFQNRRARYKTKQLEKDYDSLKASYDKLEVDYDSLLKQNDELKLEVESLKEKMSVVEKSPDPCNLASSVNPEPSKTLHSSSISNVVSANVVTIKQEDVNSAKSDVFDSESPNCVDINHKSMFEPVDSSRGLEQERSNFSQDDEDEFCRILPPPCLPKLKIESYDDLTADTCNLGNSVDDQTFWFWS